MVVIDSLGREISANAMMVGEASIAMVRSPQVKQIDRSNPFRIIDSVSNR
jgi:hypothetical protein